MPHTFESMKKNIDNIIAINESNIKKAQEEADQRLKNSVNEQDENGLTYLMHAARNQDMESLKYLLDLNADVSIKDSEGKTALDHTIDLYDNKVNHVRFYVDNEVERGLKNKEGIKKSYPFINILIRNGSDASSTNNHGDNFLFTAIRKRLPHVVDILIKNNIDVNKSHHQDNESPLMAAIAEGDKKIIDLLIEAGADVNFKDNDNKTPLITLVEKINNYIYKNSSSKYKDYAGFNVKEDEYYDIGLEECHEIVINLFNNGAILNAKDNNGFSALEYAKELKLEKIIQFLDHNSIASLPSLIEMIKNNSSPNDVLNFIRSNEIDINLKDSNGVTPLRQAVRDQNVEMTKALLAEGSDPNVLDDFGRSDIMSSLKRENLEIAHIIIKHGFNTNNEVSMNVDTLPFMAFASGDEYICNLVLKNKEVDINKTSATYGTTMFQNLRKPLRVHNINFVGRVDPKMIHRTLLSENIESLEKCIVINEEFTEEQNLALEAKKAITSVEKLLEILSCTLEGEEGFNSYFQAANALNLKVAKLLQNRNDSELHI